jgi:hypothetical protein
VSNYSFLIFNFEVCKFYFIHGQKQMNFRKRVFLIASTLFVTTISCMTKANAVEFPKDRPFFI